MSPFFKIVPGDGLNESLFSRCMYYSQRLVTKPVLRNNIAASIARMIRARHGSTPVTDSKNAQLIKARGFAILGPLFSAEQCADIHDFLRDKSLSGRQPANGRFTVANRPAHARLGEYDLADIINCPHILALANSERLIGLAGEYLQCKPTLSSLMLRWSFPTHAPVGNVQLFHRDSDDWRYMKIMVYLTDVGAHDGPHVFVLGTHKEAAPMRIRVERDDVVYRRYGKAAIQVVTGPAGTGFAVDTAGIHKGELPFTKPRLMLQIQYSLLPSFANRYRPQAYTGAGDFDRYVNRLIVA